MTQPRPEPGGLAEGLQLIAAAVFGLGAALWAAGQCGGWAWHGRWPPVPLAAAPALAIGTVRHPSTITLAWPPRARRLLPPGWALYAGTAIALGAAGSALVVSRAALGALRPARAGKWRASRTAWARRRELAPLRVRGPVPGRLIVGRRPARRGRPGALVAGEPRSSVIVLGPSQSGKTSGLAVPAILEWEGPVVATSVKTDLVRDTLGWRQRSGPAWVYDPTGSTGLAASTWTPLAECLDWQGARRVAAWLCDTTRSQANGSSDDTFWRGAAAKLLAPCLFAAATGARTMADVVAWLDTQEEEEVEALLDRAGVPAASRAAAASWARDERTRSSVYATAEVVLEAFADPTVASSAESCDIRPDRLLSEPGTLYVCSPGHEQERLQPVFTTLLHTVLASAYDRVARTGRPLDPPLLVVLDEAANIAPLRDLDALVSTAASHGVQLVTVWQDLAQIQGRYGERAATVLANHRARLFLSGCSDPATLDYASRLLGDAEIGDASVTTDPGGRRSMTRAWRERRLLTDAELRRIRPHEAILVYGHLRPVQLRLRQWFADPALRRRVTPSADFQAATGGVE